MIISAEQLHALIQLYRAGKIEVAAATGVRPPSLPLTPGEEVLARVVARLPSGSDLVTLKGALLSMQFPLPVTPGESIRLTLLGTTPRPLFALSRGVQEGVPVEISPPSRWIASILSSPEETTEPPPSRSVRLLETPPATGREIVTALKSALARSGLFYERHLQRWAFGDYPLERLRAEPHGTLPPRQESVPGREPFSETHPVDPRLTPVVREQLLALAQRSVTLGGRLTPDAPFTLTVEEREKEGEEKGAEPQRPWQGRLTLSFPTLGEIRATISLRGNKVSVSLSGDDQMTCQSLCADSPRLRERLEGAGLLVTRLEVRDG